MARQESTCWRCGAEWATEEYASPRLRVVAGGRAAEEVAAQARLDLDRWTNEGGGAARPVRAAMAGG
jgi:hypothetical protein